MIRLLFLLLLLSLFVTGCMSQQGQTTVTGKKPANNRYIDFAYDGSSIWGLTTDGNLNLFDAITGTPIAGKVTNNAAIVALANDNEGNIVIGDKSKTIKKYDKQTRSWITLFKFDHTLLAITFDSKNKCYLITSKGIFDHLANTYFYPDNPTNLQIRHEAGWFRQPALLTDKNDNIWVGFAYGEWGGELFIFNTITRKFINPDLKEFIVSLNPVKSVFESKENVFVTSGLMHFTTRGCIAKLTNFQSSLIFESEEVKRLSNDSTSSETIDGEYIGPGAYNEKDGCIYFYSQNGIFKGDPHKDLSKIEHWTKVLQLKFRWTSGQPDAIGSPMNVLKLKFLPAGQLIVLSQNDGIGIYDGKQLIMMH